MISTSLDKIRYQTRFAVHIATRDIAKRLAAAAMMMLILLWLGYVSTPIVMSVSIVGYEFCAQAVARHLPDRDDEMSVSYVVAVWAMNCTSVLFYLAPAYLLASEPSSAMLLAGFLWLFGVFVHITNTFAALPFYNWSLMAPSFGAAFLVFWLAAGNAFLPSTDTEWMITTGMMVVYIFNTYETLHKQKDTQRALNAAREEANSRLRALEHLSRHDPLTGLLNRRAFDEELSRMLTARRIGTDVCVFLIDLDGFKPINDTYSHEAGDQVLQAIAERLRGLVGATGIAARLGGDEFAMAFRSVASEQAAMRLTQYVCRAVREPVHYDEKDLHVTASVGVGLTSYAGETVEAICAAADQAMYRAKNAAGSRAVLYDKSVFERRTTLEDRASIVRAMAQGQIVPFYQPKVDLSTGRSIGFEALARWVHPEKGVLAPALFIPEINEMGLHGDFMIHMTTAILSDVEKLLSEGIDPGQVSINIPEVALATMSGRTELDILLGRYARARQHITLEITEDVFIARSADMIRESIAHFRNAGLRVSLDDFGTGFASFQHLRQLEFDELKIDTSFVSDLVTDPTAEVLVRGFLDIAEGLGVDVIAEGVETRKQADHLEQLGCRFVQGYLFGKARPLEDIRIRLFSETREAARQKAMLAAASQPLAEPAE